MLAIDVFSRKAFAQAMQSKTAATITQTFKKLVVDIGDIKELNGDAEFAQAKSLQKYLADRNIAFRAKQNKNDLAVLDSNMGHIKESIAKYLQQNDTLDWANRLHKVIRGDNKTSHQSLLHEAPDDAFHTGNPKNENTEFELREKAGRQMAAQNNVASNNQRNVLDKWCI